MVTLTQPFWNLGCRVGVLGLKGAQTQTVYYPLTILLHFTLHNEQILKECRGKASVLQGKPK